MPQEDGNGLKSALDDCQKLLKMRGVRCSRPSPDKLLFCIKNTDYALVNECKMIIRLCCMELVVQFNCSHDELLEHLNFLNRTFQGVKIFFFNPDILMLCSDTCVANGRYFFDIFTAQMEAIIRCKHRLFELTGRDGQ